MNNFINPIAKEVNAPMKKLCTRQCRGFFNFQITMAKIKWHLMNVSMIWSGYGIQNQNQYQYQYISDFIALLLQDKRKMGER